MNKLLDAGDILNEAQGVESTKPDCWPAHARTI
jgi:hypothetical protein